MISIQRCANPRTPGTDELLYRPQIKYSDTDDYVETRRFVGACWGPGQPATCLALVDESGALVDIMYAGSFSGEPRGAGGGDRDRAGGPGGYKVLEDPDEVCGSVWRMAQEGIHLQAAWGGGAAMMWECADFCMCLCADRCTCLYLLAHGSKL